MYIRKGGSEAPKGAKMLRGVVTNWTECPMRQSALQFENLREGVAAYCKHCGHETFHLAFDVTDLGSLSLCRRINSRAHGTSTITSYASTRGRVRRRTIFHSLYSFTLEFF